MAVVSDSATSTCRRWKSASVLLAAQVVLIVLFAFFSRFADDDAVTKGMHKNLDQHGASFTLFRDANWMLFVGFGLLATFLRRYAFSAIGYTWIVAALVLQWGVFVNELVMTRGRGVLVGVESLIGADFVALAVVVSCGALLGKLSPLQYFVMAIVEVVVYVFNRYIGVLVFQAADNGQSMFVHVFGAYFGLAVSKFIHQNYHENNPQEGRTYTSDIFALIGTLFLWVCFPSLNAAGAAEALQQRALVNTVIAMAACLLTTFALTTVLSKKTAFNMTHVQNAALAGGVAMGTVATLIARPYGAMLVGLVAGALSVLGFTHVGPCLAKRLGVHDTRGVHSVHALPGLFGALVGIVAAALASTDVYGFNLYYAFPAMTPDNTTTDAMVNGLVEQHKLAYGSGRGAGAQAGMQALALLVSIVFALVGGAITGLLLRLGFCEPLTSEQAYDDASFWDGAEEGMPLYQMYVLPPPAVDTADATAEETVELKITDTEKPTDA